MIRVHRVREQASVHARVQGLDAAVKGLGETGEVLDLGDGNARLFDRPGRAAGRDDLRAGLVQGFSELGQAGLVVDAEQGAPDRNPVHLPILTFLSSLTDQPSRAIRPTVSTSSARSAILIRSCRVASSSSSCTDTAACASTGPASTPSSTRNTVQPVTFTPYASASLTPCMPGKDGSSAGCVFRQRPLNCARKLLPTSFMKPAQTMRSGSKSAQAAARASSQASLVEKSRTFRVNVGIFASLARSRAVIPSRSAPTATTVAP